MIKFTKSDIEKQLVFADDNEEFYFFKDMDTKEKRTLAQNNTFHMIMGGISKHLGVEKSKVQEYILKGCFGVSKIQLSKTEMEVSNVSSTRDLTKEQAIQFIDVLIAFAKLKNVPIEITPREIQSLYDSYNN